MPYSVLLCVTCVCMCVCVCVCLQARTRSRSGSFSGRETELSIRAGSSANSKNSDTIKQSLVEGMLCYPLLGGMFLCVLSRVYCIVLYCIVLYCIVLYCIVV